LTKKKIGYWSVVSIGIGGMVGGGIFAVLGLAVELAQGGTPVAFALAGVVALITSYAYARLSVAIPSQGGTVEFLNQAFGPGIFTGGLNVLLLLSYVIMLSLYARAFGSYGASFFPAAVQPIWIHIFICVIILLLTALNSIGASTVGEAEEFIVGFKILILLFFVGAGLWSVDAQALKPTTWAPSLQLIAGGMIIFLAYEGFELISNTAADVKEPHRILPRAFLSAVGFVLVLYVLIAITVIGNLPLTKIAAAQDYALAVAARPFLGQPGFILIAIAALLSTASAINATLYGASRISYIVAKEGELPEVLERKVWHRPLEGLLGVSVLTLLVANIFDVSRISLMGSAGFLIIFICVNVSAFRLHQKIGGARWLYGLGVVVCFAALDVLVGYTFMKSPSDIWILVFLVAIAFVLEVFYRWRTGRTIHPIK
jgi:amino acid transporter